LDVLERYVTTARALGSTAISANDHIVWQGSWLDAPTMLAASLPFADGLTLATTIGLLVIRGPAVYAKTMATLDHLSGGRVIAGVAPGSSADDYALAGVPHAERWSASTSPSVCCAQCGNRARRRSAAPSIRPRGSGASHRLRARSARACTSTTSPHLASGTGH
jgi:hypothetical protein